ncbi:MAG: peptidyl-prolyl cis-trans isomerase [Candidatus Cloacimonetes bacterium]|nr:peptidyl-prolyl cis-trans isomerase [Candidatus Cloacimonadota bacterium]
MFIGKYRLAMFLLAILMSFSILYANEGDNEIILAEYDGGEITKKELLEKVKSIPAMYQSRFQSPEGKIDLLDQMCVEELFYLEAISMGLADDKEVNVRISNQIEAVLSKDMRQEILTDKINFTQKEKQNYFVNNMDKFKDKPFQEAEGQIERMMKPEKEKLIIDAFVQDAVTEFKIVNNEELINSFNFENIEQIDSNKEGYLFTSNIPELNLSINEFITLFKDHPKFSKVPIKDKEEFLNFIEKTKESKILSYKAKETGLDKKEGKKEYFDQIHRTMLLRTAYNRLVIEEIDLSDEAIKKHYDENIKTFSSKAIRKIQQYVFDNEKAAKKILKKAKKVKKDSTKTADLIKEFCTDSKNNGMLANIYQNGIIPNIGKDETYSNMVWSTKPNKFSKIFKNSKDEYVFFRILEDIVAEPKPFDDVKVSIKRDKQKNESKKLFESLKNEFKEKYHVKQYPDKLIIKLTAKEYFTKAEEAQKKRRFRDAIYYYEQVMKFYKNDKDDYKALFMKGFILSEELKEKEEAIQIFDEIVEKYPVGELHESATYMKNELLGKNKTFENLENEDQKE